MRMNTGLLAVGVFLAGGWLAAVADETLPLKNGDFSAVQDRKPAEWKLMGESAGHTLERVEVDGRPCAKLTYKPGREAGKRIPDAYMLQRLSFTMKRWDAFEVSLRARMEGSENGSFHLEFEGGSSYFHKVFNATSQWQVFKTAFRLSKGSVDPGERIEIWLHSPGTLYVSSICLKRLDAVVKFSESMVVQPSQGKNLVWNGAFGAGPNGWSTCGRYVQGGNLENLHGTVEIRRRARGQELPRCGMGGEYMESLLEVPFSNPGKEVLQGNYWASNFGWIPVEKDASYTLSAWMRASQGKCFPILGIRYCVKPEEKEEKWLPHFVSGSGRDGRSSPSPSKPPAIIAMCLSAPPGIAAKPAWLNRSGWTWISAAFNWRREKLPRTSSRICRSKLASSPHSQAGFSKGANR